MSFSVPAPEPLASPWRIITVYCIYCHHDWTAMIPYGVNTLECPSCHLQGAIRRCPTA